MEKGSAISSTFHKVVEKRIHIDLKIEADAALISGVKYVMPYPI
jgi:hypothetical protein